MKLNNNFIKSSVFCLSFIAAGVSAALYEVTEYTPPSKFKQAFGESINNNGDVVFRLQGGSLAADSDVQDYTIYSTGSNSYSTLYNHPIDLDSLNNFLSEPITDLTKSTRFVAIQYLQTSTFTDYLYVPEHTEEVTTDNVTTTNTIAETVVTAARSRQSDGRYQRFGQYWSAILNGNVLEHTPILDQVNPVTNDYGFEFSEQVLDINSDGTIVGFTDSDFDEITFTKTVPEIFFNSANQAVVSRDVNENIIKSDKTFTYKSRKYARRGFVKANGNVTLLPPVDTSYEGGFSTASDISDTGFIVGYGTIGYEKPDDYDTFIEQCQESHDYKQYPFELCKFSVDTLTNSQNVRYIPRITRAHMWQVDGQGTLVQQAKSLGSAFDHIDFEDDSILPVVRSVGVREDLVAGISVLNLSSQAVAVNNAGIAVGRSYAHVDTREATRTVDDVEQTYNQYLMRDYAAVFKDSTVTTIANDISTMERSWAVDINDNNTVIGNAVINHFSGDVAQPFYYHLDTGEFFTFNNNDDFQHVEAKAINNNGQIVGSIEIDTISGTQPINHAFLYDIKSKTFTDLNDAISCDADFTLIDAVDINDHGEIIALASGAEPLRDVEGEVTTDITTGEIKNTFVIKTIKLNKVDGGQQESCFSQENTFKRQGASLPYWFAGLIMIFGLFRRRFS
ncbi:hypothetical protein C2869_14765 [Saccharobesus litoralis]|uniref:DUF3466 family protein n=1 Tax=Saccharobesus litoralis TaxID=2172099 RepID=A0A2S0VTT2_9ALTE|nr:DUF3466 family protein [Saccharobesus litoralis]AWB67621.1 hypothetical protein C2869_14765 [Saccharobesus litoralis]